MIIFLTILLVLSLLFLLGMFFTKLDFVSKNVSSRVRVISINQSNNSVSLWLYFRKKFLAAMRKFWHFVLEAKDLMPATTKTIHDQAEKVKSVFRIRIRSSAQDPQWLPEAAQLSLKPTANQSPEDFYLDAIKKNPGDTSSYEALGRLYLQNKNFTDAIETYEFLTKFDPSKDIYFSNLGLAQYSIGEYKKAIHSYEQALKANNKVATRWINLSLCFEALEDYAKTVRALVSAIELDKFNINYLTMLADTYLKIPNNIRAEQVLEQILSLDPTNRSAREKLMRLKI